MSCLASGCEETKRATSSSLLNAARFLAGRAQGRERQTNALDRSQDVDSPPGSKEHVVVSTCTARSSVGSGNLSEHNEQQAEGVRKTAPNRAHISEFAAVASSGLYGAQLQTRKYTRVKKKKKSSPIFDGRKNSKGPCAVRCQRTLKNSGC